MIKLRFVTETPRLPHHLHELIEETNRIYGLGIGWLSDTMLLEMSQDFMNPHAGMDIFQAAMDVVDRVVDDMEAEAYDTTASDPLYNPFTVAELASTAYEYLFDMLLPVLNVIRKALEARKIPLDRIETSVEHIRNTLALVVSYDSGKSSSNNTTD